MAAPFCRRSFLNYKNFLFQTQKRTGYVVLIPESPKEVAECNVTSLENLPDFTKLDAETSKQIVNKYAQQCETGIWELDEHLQKQLKSSEKIDVLRNVIEPLEILSVPFLSSWGVIKTLYVANQNNLPLKVFQPVSGTVFQVRKNKYNIKSIYEACKMQLKKDTDNLTEEQKRILEKFVWEGVLNGFELDENKSLDLKHCYAILNAKRITYQSKMKNSKLIFNQVINDPNFIRDSPLDFLRNTAMNSEEPLKGPWTITLYDGIYMRFLEYCDSRDARRHVWLSYNQLCSSNGDVRCNATVEIEEIRKQRQRLAQILGYPSYVHLAMKTKMAGSVENVQNVLFELLEIGRNAQEREIYELEKFAYAYDFRGTLELWDLLYWMRMERKYKFGLDELALKDYFPLGQVLLGLIALCEQLFGIQIEEEISVAGWHPDVRYFRILDGKTKTLLGGFYLDPYARKGKAIRETADGWFLPIRPRSRICASLPISSIVFSFTSPTDDKPCLLYFKEVESLFEKFGSMLQYTLTQMNYSEVSGMSNIEWDTVNVCSFFMKNWLSEKGTLESISGHYDTGEPLPNHILECLCNVHKQMAGTRLCQDIYFSNLDLQIHLQDKYLMSIVDEIWPEHLLFAIQKLDLHPYGFKDIFNNFWGSSYYSIVWSKMIAADAFLAFKEVGFDNQEKLFTIGQKFRSTFFASGGGSEPNAIFKRFRGRDPRPKSLAEFLELKTPAPTHTPSTEKQPEASVA